MNIVIVMSGGVGNRFGAVIPKQYNLIAGKPVIDYVLEAVEASRLTDKIVVVMDPQWVPYSEKLKNSGYDIVSNGDSRIGSMYNGLKHIKENYACEKIVVVDAVAPFIYGELIDTYFEKLDKADAVITSQKITGGFTDYNNTKLDREKFIITQSPEAFNFELLWKSYDLDFQFQETACMLPDDAVREYYFEFKNNLKLTYDFELEYAAFLLQRLGKINKENNLSFFDKEVLITEGIKSFLLRNRPEETMQWINGIYQAMPALISKYEISSFRPNQISRYGLVLHAKSGKYGNIIFKFIPAFVERYERELSAMKILSDRFMAAMIDYDESLKLMVLTEIKNARFACFDQYVKLIDFFDTVLSEAKTFESSMKNDATPYYFDELCGKRVNIDAIPYCKEEVVRELDDAIELYRNTFADAALYYIHGDLHENNILDDGTCFHGIDPNGMIAPLAFEFVRYIRNDVRNHPEFGYANRFNILTECFTRFMERTLLVKAFIIDMAFCTYNSVFENEKPDETLVDLELIRIAKAYLSELS